MPSAVDVDVCTPGDGGDVPWFVCAAAADDDEGGIGTEDVGDVDRDDGDADVGVVDREDGDVAVAAVGTIRDESVGNWEFVVAAMRASIRAVVSCILSMCSRMFSNNPFFRSV